MANLSAFILIIAAAMIYAPSGVSAWQQYNLKHLYRQLAQTTGSDSISFYNFEIKFIDSNVVSNALDSRATRFKVSNALASQWPDWDNLRVCAIVAQKLTPVTGLLVRLTKTVNSTNAQQTSSVACNYYAIEIVGSPPPADYTLCGALSPAAKLLTPSLGEFYFPLVSLQFVDSAELVPGNQPLRMCEQKPYELILPHVDTPPDRRSFNYDTTTISGQLVVYTPNSYYQKRDNDTYACTLKVQTRYTSCNPSNRESHTWTEPTYESVNVSECHAWINTLKCTLLGDSYNMTITAPDKWSARTPLVDNLKDSKSPWGAVSNS